MSAEVAYSVIIPAYNEAQFLPRTLAALLSAMAKLDGIGEIIVVDNNSDDTTARIAREYGAEVVFEPINQISRARNAGAFVARSRALIFLDADTCASEALLAAAIRALHSGDVCGGGARVSIDHDNRFARSVTTLWNALSARLGLAAGCFVFCRRDAFDAVGGFSEEVYASEEIWFSRALRHWGKRCGKLFLILDEDVLTSGRKIDWLSGPAIAKQMLVFLIFPFAVRSKRFCGAWYKRPKISARSNNG